MDKPSNQVSAGDPGPRRRCCHCNAIHPTYFDVTGGQWELHCKKCNKRVANLTHNSKWADEAFLTRRIVNKPPPEHKDKV